MAAGVFGWFNVINFSDHTGLTGWTLQTGLADFREKNSSFSDSEFQAWCQFLHHKTGSWCNEDDNCVY